MRYKFKTQEQEGIEFNIRSDKDILKYAVGALLYMPATNIKIADEVINRRYKALKSLVLDLEDSLSDNLIGYGLECIGKIVQKIDKAIKNNTIGIDDIPLIFIRVRNSEHLRDVGTYLIHNSLIEYITGFNLPKFDTTNCDGYLKEFKTIGDIVRYKYNKEIYIMPILESADIIYIQNRQNLLTLYNKINTISENVLNIRVGATDFCNIYSVRRGLNDTIYDIGVIANCLYDIINIFSKNYVVSAPVYEYYENGFNQLWKDNLKNEVHKDILNGFIGKTAIHPSQLEVIQESLMVKDEDYKDALNILGMSSNTSTCVSSSNIENKRMNELKTHMRWANKIIALANIYGIKDMV